MSTPNDENPYAVRHQQPPMPAPVQPTWPQQWPQPQQSSMPMMPSTDALFAPRPSGLGIAALVLGIVSVVLSWIPFVNVVAIICAIVAIALGAFGVRNSHRVMSWCGVGLGVFGILVAVAFDVVVIVGINKGMQDYHHQVGTVLSTSSITLN